MVQEDIMSWIAQHVSYQVQWQTDVLLFIQSLRNDPLSVFFYFVSNIGQTSCYMAAVCVIFWCVNKRAGYFLGFSVVAAGLVNMGLKGAFQIPRPYGHAGLVPVEHPVSVLETGYSFPSGHSTGAGSFWLALYLAFRKRWIAVLSICMMLLIPLSRLYFAVHTPIDVTTGLVLGSLSALGVCALLCSPGKKGKYLPLVPVVVFGAAGFFAHHPYYWAGFGSLSGLTAGYYIENEAIRFEMTKKNSRIIFRLVIGFAGAAVLGPLLEAVLPGTPVSGSFRSFCLGLWITAGAPALFSKLRI